MERNSLLKTLSENWFKILMIVLIPVTLYSILLYSGVTGLELINPDKNDTGQTPQDNQLSQMSVSIPDEAPLQFMLWGMRKNGISQLDDSTSFETGVNDREVLFRFMGDEDDLVWLPPNLVDTAAISEGFAILPYKMIGSENIPAVYMREDSEVNNLSELKGGEIIVIGSSSVIITRTALNHKYGINSSNTDISVRGRFTAIEMLRKGEVDAVQLVYPPSNMEGIKPVFYPSRYLAEEDNLSRPPIGLFIIKDESKAERASKIVEIMDEANQRGVSNMEKVIEKVNEERSRNLSEMLREIASTNEGDLIVPLTEKDERTLQKMFDLSYQDEFPKTKINVSESVVENN